MSRPLPRWYRHRCTHENRVEIRDGLGLLFRDYCQDCGATFAECTTYTLLGHTRPNEVTLGP